MARKEALKKQSIDENLYHPINPEEDYNRDTFVPAFGKFSDLESYIQALIKDSRDPSAISDLGALLHKDSNFYEEMSNPARVARVEADRAYSHSVDATAQYVKRNLDDFFEITEDNSLVNYVVSVPIYRTGNEEHDEFVDSVESIREISEIAQSKDPSKSRNYVQRKLENVPDWLKESFAVLQSDSTYVQALFQNFATHDQREFEKKLTDKDGKIRRKFLEGVVKDSLKEAYKQYDKETNEGDKEDIWKIDIRPHYTELARTVYPKERAERKEDEDPKRVKRRRKRAKIGMSM